MDSLTHILVGAATGQAFSKKGDGYKPLMWGAIAGSIPDIDSAFQIFLSPANSMLFHRGISHSLLLWALLAPLLALLINKIYKGNKQSYFKWLKITAFAWLSHIFLDLFNTYGTGIFEPFSHARIAFDAINVVDFVFLVPLILLSVSFLFIAKNHKAKVLLASITLFFTVGYVSLSSYNKLETEARAKEQLAEMGITPNRVISTPLPLSNFAWKVVAEGDEGYYSGVYYDFWRNKINFDYLPKNSSLEEQFESYDNFQILKRFTKGWYVLTQNSNNEIVLNDLRFSSLDPEKGVLQFVLHDDGDILDIERTAPKRHITPQNTREYYKQVFSRKYFERTLLH